MKRQSFAVAIFALGVFLPAAAFPAPAATATVGSSPSSQADTSCVPPCRAGYACSGGRCATLCNPPCGPGLDCTAAATCAPVPVAPPGPVAPFPGQSPYPGYPPPASAVAPATGYPPGYYYTPAPAPGSPEARIAFLRADIASLEDQRRRTSYVGPGIGIGLAAVLGIVGVTMLAVCLSGEAPECRQQRDEPSVLLVLGGGAAAAAVVVGVISGVRIGSRASRRRAIDAKIEQDAKELRGLGVQLGGIGFDPITRTFSLAARF